MHTMMCEKTVSIDNKYLSKLNLSPSRIEKHMSITNYNLIGVTRSASVKYTNSAGKNKDKKLE